MDIIPGQTVNPIDPNPTPAPNNPFNSGGLGSSSPTPSMGPVNGHNLGAAPSPISPPTPAPMPVKKGGLKNVLMMVAVAVVAAAAAGGGVYYWQMQRYNSLSTSSKNTQNGLESQISSLQSQLSQANAKPATPTAPAVTPGSDTDEIKAAVKADCESDVFDKLFAPVSIIKTSGNFATAKDDCGPKSGSGTTYTATVKKSDGRWVVVYVSRFTPPSSIRAKYGIPATLY